MRQAPHDGQQPRRLHEKTASLTSQCRVTLEILATIKNPPVVIARQANINNCGLLRATACPSRAAVPYCSARVG